MAEINMRQAIEEAIQVLYMSPNPAESKVDRIISWFIRYNCQKGGSILEVAKDTLATLVRMEVNGEDKVQKFKSIQERLADSIRLMEEYNSGKEEVLSELEDRGLLIKVVTIKEEQVPF